MDNNGKEGCAMSVQLLDKTRKINKLLHNNNSSKVVFNDICQVLTDILDSNILVISRKGKVLGVSLSDQVEEIHELIADKVGGFRRLSIRSISRASALEPFLCINATVSTRSTILF